MGGQIRSLGAPKEEKEIRGELKISIWHAIENDTKKVGHETYLA